MKKSSQTPLRFNSVHAAGRCSIQVWLTVGVIAGLLSTVVGCTSQQIQQPKAEQSATEQPAAQQPVAQQPTDTSPEASPEAAAGSSRTLENVQLTAGSDPLAIVLATRQPNTEAKGTEQIRLSYPAADKAVVVVTKTGLPDDSVAAIRTRYEFAPVASSTGATQWQLTQATEQNKCRDNRGPQDWSGELCK
ncbi:MAG: hypothetical protein ACKO7W_07205 [Elainella sp.]